MNEIMIFESSEFGKVRTAGTSDNPLFCLKDICDILELGNPSQVKARLDDGVITNEGITDSLGRQQNVTFINEDGLYDVILDSRKPQAKKFRKWITSEVIPAIRKTGSYSLQAQLPKDYLSALKALVVAEEEKQQLQLTNQELIETNTELANTITAMQPKVSYYDKILNSSGTVTITQIAQDYGMTPRKLNNKLHELGIQRKVNGQWILYSQYLKEGYVQSKTLQFQTKDGRTYFQTLTEWTSKGRLFVYKTLKLNNILPLIEQN
jgi:anti-repressor protein